MCINFAAAVIDPDRIVARKASNCRRFMTALLVTFEYWSNSTSSCRKCIDNTTLDSALGLKAIIQSTGVLLNLIRIAAQYYSRLYFCKKINLKIFIAVTGFSHCRSVATWPAPIAHRQINIQLRDRLYAPCVFPTEKSSAFDLSKVGLRGSF
jgi:hypothetical protein